MSAAGVAAVGRLRERAAPHPDRAFTDSVLKLATVVDDLADGGVDTIVKVGADDLLDVIEAENFDRECLFIETWRLLLCSF